MGQELQTWRSEGDRQWLALLVATMEEVSRPEFRAAPDAFVLAAVYAQLARPQQLSSIADRHSVG
jgi:hypothetical protein